MNKVRLRILFFLAELGRWAGLTSHVCTGVVMRFAGVFTDLKVGHYESGCNLKVGHYMGGAKLKVGRYKTWGGRLKVGCCMAFALVLAAVFMPGGRSIPSAWLGTGLRHYNGVVHAAQDGAIAPAENLVVEGVPAIPASLVATAGRYGSYRNAVLADWNPKGREMLIATRFADTAQLHLVRAPGGERQQLTFFADAVSNGRF